LARAVRKSASRCLSIERAHHLSGNEVASTYRRRFLPPGGPFARPQGGRHLRYSLGRLWSHFSVWRGRVGHRSERPQVLVPCVTREDEVTLEMGTSDALFPHAACRPGLRSWTARSFGPHRARLKPPAHDRGTAVHELPRAPDPATKLALSSDEDFHLAWVGR
jgi:hypothetical protein